MDVGDDSSGNGFCYYLRYFAWATGMQIAFLSAFPEHLPMADRQGVYGRQYLLEGGLKGRIHLVHGRLGGERLSGLNCR